MTPACLMRAFCRSHAHVPTPLPACNYRPEVRSLLDTTIDIPTYWIPTTQGSLCQGGNCCDANAEALPYWLQHLNSSSFSVGTKRHTTFFLRLHSDRQGCLAGPSAGDCCNADLAELRLDIGKHDGT